MHPVPRLSLIDQTAQHLQQGIESGRWKGALPGVVRLAGELGVSKDTAQAALAILEARGSIISRGRGKHREVAPKASLPESPLPNRRSLRVGILTRDDLGKSSALTQTIMLQLAHDLGVLGHQPLHAPKSQLALGNNPARVGKMVEECGADVWVVSSGSSEVLTWFRKKEIPFIALGGRMGDYPTATSSMRSGPALKETLQQLIGLGHRRVVLVCSPDWVRPTPAKLVREFLQQLEDAGLPSGDYNTPYHEETPEGFQKLLESLFQITPPTAMIVPNMHYAFAVIAFLAKRNLHVPRDLSLIVRGPDPAFDWVRPKIAHFHYDQNILVRRIVRWVESCAKGMQDYEMKHIDAALVSGDTIAPPPSE